MYESNIFEQIKEYVKPTEIARRYLGDGLYKNGSLWYKSPFRTLEKTASFCFNDKKGIHDFGVNKHYDIISFVEELFNEKPIESVKRIIIDFNLPIKQPNKDKSKPNFEYDKEFIEYKKNKEKEKNKRIKNDNICKIIFESSIIVYRFWNNLLLDTKNLDFDLFGNELSIIYKNKNYFDGLVDILNNSDNDFILKNKDSLIKTIERGIIFMDFEKISLIAFREEKMPDCSTDIELLTYYKLKELYIKHYRKQINDEDAKKEKQKIKGLYYKQVSLEEFYSNLHKKISDNIRSGENDLIKLSKMINNNATEKELLDVAIPCIYKLTDDIMLLKAYQEKY